MPPSDKFLRTLAKPFAWIPVIIINAIVAWSYFAYIIVFGFDTVETTTEKVIYLVLFHPLFLLFIVSYWKTILCDSGLVPSQFYLSVTDKERYDSAENPQAVVDDLAKNLPIITRSVNGAARFCEICQLIKPDRCHHCSMCNRCILKMDHHCPWVNNCVGFGNYKYFFLFLLYGILYTLFVAATTFKYFLKFWSAGSPKIDSSLHVLFLFFIAAMFFISLWTLFGYHIFLSLNNRSTLESFRAPIFSSGPDKNGFNLGKANNFKQIFGNNKYLWFLPTYTTLGNGYVYPSGCSQGPESEGLLNGVASFDRNLHISEHDDILSDDSNGELFQREVKGVASECEDGNCEEGKEDSESEIEIYNTRRTDHVAVSIEETGHGPDTL